MEPGVAANTGTMTTQPIGMACRRQSGPTAVGYAAQMDSPAAIETLSHGKRLIG